MRAALRWLTPGDPLGHAARAMLDRLTQPDSRTDRDGPVGPASQPQTAELLKLLSPGKGRWRRLWLAAWLLGRSAPGEGERDRAVQVLVDLVQAPFPEAGWLMCCGCFYWPALPFIIAEEKLREWRFQSVREAVVYALRLLGAREAVAVLLAITQEKKKLYPRGSHSGLRAAMSEALPQLLDLVTEEDRRSLPETVTPHLAEVARTAPDDVAVAALEALGRAGDGRAAATVEKLARARQPGPRREAARRVLGVLLERRERDRMAAMLLQPASAPNTQSELLLRPASGPRAVDESVLLRPAPGPDAGVEQTTGHQSQAHAPPRPTEPGELREENRAGE